MRKVSTNAYLARSKCYEDLALADYLHTKKGNPKDWARGDWPPMRVVVCILPADPADRYPAISTDKQTISVPVSSKPLTPATVVKQIEERIDFGNEKIADEIFDEDVDGNVPSIPKELL